MFIYVGSPPSKKITPLEDYIAANDAAAKLVLMHEIALDEAFKLPDPDESSNRNDTVQGIVKKSNHHYTFGITPRCVTSGGAHLPHLARGLRRSGGESLATTCPISPAQE